MDRFRRPAPVLDMTPEGGFRQPARPPLIDRVLARVGGVALLLTLAAGGLLIASLAFVVIGVLLPVLIGAGIVAVGALWWRARRLRRAGLPAGFVLRR